MNAGSEDQDWLREFARSGLEAAFCALVERHSSMVYGTALRITRESAGAEEATQNVFIALARKAPFLPRDISVGAWLHRSAVLEAKNWVRGEIRRKERERRAGEMMSQSEESLLEVLSPVLDEAMLELPEKDRVALLLRFHQQQSLRDVGRALGVSDDTAQKRVGKAVDLLTKAFRKRGYAVPSAALTVTLLERTATALPVQLGQALATAALSAAGSSTLTGGLWIAAKFMSLSKTQTAAVCLLLATAPIGLEWQALGKARAENASLGQSLENARRTQDALEVRRAEIQRELALIQNDVLARRVELNQLRAAPPAALPPDEQLYAWDKSSEYVRLPKGILDTLTLTPAREVFRRGEVQPEIHRGEVVNDDGEVSPVLLEALGLDARQASDVQHAVMNFAADFHSVAQAKTYLTNAMPPGVNFQVAPGERLFTHHTPAFEEEGATMKAELEQKVQQIIGPERATLLMERQARRDLARKFREFGKHERWVAAAQTPDGMFSVARTDSYQGTSYGGSVSTLKYEQLPEELKPYFSPETKE